MSEKQLSKLYQYHYKLSQKFRVLLMYYNGMTKTIYQHNHIAEINNRYNELYKKHKFICKQLIIKLSHLNKG